jgi:hypothetical protein
MMHAASRCLNVVVNGGSLKEYAEALEPTLSAALENHLLVHAENKFSAFRENLRQSIADRAGRDTVAGRQRVSGDANCRILLTEVLMSSRRRSILAHNTPRFGHRYFLSSLRADSCQTFRRI